MSDKTLKVNISASDNASSVLAKIGNSAKTLGAALEETGQSGDALEKVSASAAKMGTALERSASQGAKGVASLSKEIKSLDSEISAVAKTMAGMGAALTAAVTVPMAAGTKAAWNQVDAVQKATVALRVYERDAAKVNQVLSSLVAYARSDMGVLFQREDLFHAATALRVMGAETDKLVGYVETMSRSVATGAGNWAELEQVIGRVGSTGQLTGVEFDNLTKMGFQLDESLRNTVVTWDELFSALDAGIPGMGDSLNTIEGQTIRLSSAFRGLGIEILQIDKDTSQFIEGGFGDQLYQGIGRATELIKAMAPAAAVAGDGLAVMASGATMAVDAFLALPQPVQTALVGLTGISGMALTAGGAFLFLLPKVLESAAAFRTLRQSTTIMSALSMAINPVTLGIGALVIGGGLMYAAFNRAGESTRKLDAELSTLAGTIESLKLSGETGLAAQVTTLLTEITTVTDALRNGKTEVINALFGTNFETQMDLLTSGVYDDLKRVMDMSDDFASHINKTLETLTAEQQSIYLDYVQGMLDSAVTSIDGSDLDDKMSEVMLKPASEIPGVMEAATESVDGLTDSATGLGAALKLLQGEAKSFVDELMQLNTITDDDSLGERLMKTLGMDASQRGQIGMALDTIRQLNVALDDMPGPGAEQSDWLDWINQANAGTVEHQRRVEAANTARREEARTTGMVALAHSTNASAMDLANEVMGRYASRQDAIVAAGAAYQEFIERQTEYIDQLRTLAGMDDALSLSATVSDLAAVANAAQDAASALDTVFRVIVGNTNAIGSQVDGVEKWALELINVRGEYGKIDDLLAAGAITLGQYNDAQSAQETISTANAAIQQDILTIQAKQAPLIAEHTAALEAQMGVIADMPAHQQLVALSWMDATTAGRAFEFQQLAIEAASGRMGKAGEEAFGSYITGAAQADPALKALLLDMGLISEGADGTITVSTDGVEGAMSDVDQLRLSINALIETLGGTVPELALEVTGADDVDNVAALVANLPTSKDIAITVGLTESTGIGGRVSAMLDRLLGRGGGGEAEPAVAVPIELELNAGAIEALRGEMASSPVEVPVTFVSSAVDVGAALGSGGVGRGAGSDVTIAIDAVDNATAIIDDVLASAAAVDGTSATVTINATDTATLTIGDAISFLASVNGYTSTMAIAAIDVASPVIGDAVSFLSSVDGLSSTLYIDAVDNASAVIGDAVRFLSSVDGYSATMTLNMVTSSIGGKMHGGIPGYATGGVLFRGGEAGPEIAHFATGGTALIPYDGLYSAPRGTYISPNNAVNNSFGGVSVTVNVSGPVFGITDLTEQVSRELVPVIADVFGERYRGMGVR